MEHSSKSEKELDPDAEHHEGYGKPFSSRGLIESNLRGLYEEFVLDGTDQMVILVVGGSNTGKTSLSLLAQQYLLGEVKPENIALDHEEWKEIHTTNDNEDLVPPKKVIVYEEGRDSFFRSNAITKENKEAKDILYEYRSFQNVLFINFQNIEDIEPTLPLHIADGLFRTVKKGWTHFYGKRTMKKMWYNDRSRKFKGWAKPDFKDGYPDPRNKIPNEWEEYEMSNIRKLNTNPQEEAEEEAIDTTNVGSAKQNISDYELEVLKAAQDRGEITQKNMVGSVYQTRQAANKALNKLKRKGFLEKNAAHHIPGSTRYVYELNEKGEKVLEAFL